MENDGIHLTSEVFIVYRNRVLLRMHPKLRIWLSIGGHIEPGEDPNQAALREVKEEVGLDVELWAGRKEFHVDEASFRNLIPPVALNRHITATGHEHATLVFFATSDTDAVVPEHESDQWRWVSKEELAGMDLVPNIREYAQGALKELAS
jgi:8-oxo-dGTP pyrophosphatase MutT (NUDIX family)